MRTEVLDENDSNSVKSKKLFKLLKRKKIALKACGKFFVMQKGKGKIQKEIPAEIIENLNLKKVNELNHIFLMADEKKLGWVTLENIRDGMYKFFSNTMFFLSFEDNKKRMEYQ